MLDNGSASHQRLMASHARPFFFFPRKLCVYVAISGFFAPLQPLRDSVVCTPTGWTGEITKFPDVRDANFLHLMNAFFHISNDPLLKHLSSDPSTAIESVCRWRGLSKCDCWMKVFISLAPLADRNVFRDSSNTQKPPDYLERFSHFPKNSAWPHWNFSFSTAFPWTFY